jgi:hypothetical protein
MNEFIFETDVQPDRIIHLPKELPIGVHVRIMIQPLSSATPIYANQQRAGSHCEPPSAAFPVTDFESPTQRSVYQGPPLSLQQMRDAIDWEAGQQQ